MRDALYRLSGNEESSLQIRIREMLITLVTDGYLSAGDAIPSTRAMAHRIGVSRNTVTLAYQALVADGFLLPRNRSGFYVDMEVARAVPAPEQKTTAEPPIEWADRLALRPSEQTNISKPKHWSTVDYPFIYGQVDAGLFPIAEWRDCVRQAMGKQWMDAWTEDRFMVDDPELIRQIRRRLLPRRGILARDEEVLITLGAQNALYLVANLLVGSKTKVAIEDPGYPDVRNIFRLLSRHVRCVPVDDEGITISQDLRGSDVVFVTPSHQFPTTVTMSSERRLALLAAAREDDAIIIEDDYEFETNYVGAPLPALKSYDGEGRVIYVGSFSKSLMPGLRLGFVVAPKPLIDEIRALRRLQMRHPPGNNQRAAALFLANGHYDTLTSRIHRVYRERWEIMGKALEELLPGWCQWPSFGGTSYWLNGPHYLDAERLAEAALARSVLIEPGSVFFNNAAGHRNTLRLGFSSVQTDRVADGVRKLVDVMKTMPAQTPR